MDKKWLCFNLIIGIIKMTILIVLKFFLGCSTTMRGKRPWAWRLRPSRLSFTRKRQTQWLCKPHRPHRPYRFQYPLDQSRHRQYRPVQYHFDQYSYHKYCPEKYCHCQNPNNQYIVIGKSCFCNIIMSTNIKMIKTIWRKRESLQNFPAKPWTSSPAKNLSVNFDRLKDFIARYTLRKFFYMYFTLLETFHCFLDEKCDAKTYVSYWREKNYRPRQ